MRTTLPNAPEALTYAVLASVGIDIVLAIVLGVRGDGLGVVLVLAIAAGAYWFLCRHAVTLVSAAATAALGALLLLLGAIADLASGYPYCAILFLVASAALGFVCLSLHQGTRPAELRIGSIAAVDVRAAATHLAMLAQLRDAGILTPEEYTMKAAGLGI